MTSSASPQEPFIRAQEQRIQATSIGMENNSIFVLTDFQPALTDSPLAAPSIMNVDDNPTVGGAAL